MDALADRQPGSVVRVSGPLVEVAGAASASMLEVMMVGPQRISAETVAIAGDRVTLQAYEYTGGLEVGAPVQPTGEPLSGLLGPGLLGNVFDGLMRPLSSASLWLTPDRPTATQDPAILERDWTFLPSAQPGSTVTPGSIIGTVPNAGSVEHRVLVPWGDADVIVYVGCGERGNEMADVLNDLSTLADTRVGGNLIDRTVIIANTSNMPMMARESSIYTGITVAEFYRDMGYNVVLIADSTSRWAEALREFANRNGDLPAEEGYPAHLASALAAFYEIAGRVTTLGGGTGSVTVIGAVSPPGGDMTEPVTTDTLRFVRSLWLLDRDLAYSRHYPAVSWTGSFARDVDELGRWFAERGDPNWARRRSRATELLAEADRLSSLAEIIGAT